MKWIKTEDDYLKKFSRMKYVQEMCLDLNRSFSSILNRLWILRLRISYSDKLWTNKEIMILKKYYKIMSRRDIKDNYLKNRTLPSIDRKLHRIGLVPKSYWTKKETGILIKNQEKTSIHLSKLIGTRTVKSIRSMRLKLGLNTPNRKFWVKTNPKFFNEYEDYLLKKHYGKLFCFQIKDNFKTFKKRPKCSIYHRARYLGLSGRFGLAGRLNPNWQHGKSREPYPLKWSETFKDLIRKRDGCCMMCGFTPERISKLTKRKLCVHHIDGNKRNINSSNLVSLCIFCHSSIQKNFANLQDHFHAKLMLLV